MRAPTGPPPGVHSGPLRANRRLGGGATSHQRLIHEFQEFAAGICGPSTAVPRRGANSVHARRAGVLPGPGVRSPPGPGPGTRLPPTVAAASSSAGGQSPAAEGPICRGQRNAQRNRRFLTDPSAPMQAREPTRRCKHRPDQQVFEAPLGKTNSTGRTDLTGRDLSTTFEVRGPISTPPSTARPRAGRPPDQIERVRPRATSAPRRRGAPAGRCHRARRGAGDRRPGAPRWRSSGARP